MKCARLTLPLTSFEGQDPMRSEISNAIVNDSILGTKQFIESCCHQRLVSRHSRFRLVDSKAPAGANFSPLFPSASRAAREALGAAGGAPRSTINEWTHRG